MTEQHAAATTAHKVWFWITGILASGCLLLWRGGAIVATYAHHYPVSGIILGWLTLFFFVLVWAGTLTFQGYKAGAQAQRDGRVRWVDGSA